MNYASFTTHSPYEAPKNLFTNSDEKRGKVYTTILPSSKSILSTPIHLTGNDGKTMKAIIAGGLAGGIEMMLTYPTEYVKTHLQLDQKGKRRKYNGIMDCVAKTVNRHGVRGLYNGMSVLVYGAIPKVGVRFTVYEYLKNRLKDEHSRLDPSKRFICGLGAGVFEAIFVVTPMETIKVKFIHDQRRAQPVYQGFIHGISTIVQKKGIFGLYEGVSATILKQGSNHGIRFFLMETFSDIYLRDRPDGRVPKWLVGTFGAVSGLASVLFNGPLDVLKTRMQSLEAAQYKNTWDCAKTIALNEGPLAFYKGTVMRVIGVCLNVPIVFILYETFMDIFDKIWPNDF